MRILRNLAAAVAIPVLLVACSSDSSNPPSTTGGTTSTTGETGDRAFFNDDAGFSFANTMGGGFSNAFDAIFGGLGAGSGATASSGIATRSGLSARLSARATESETSACDGGGTASYSITTNDTTMELTSFALAFNNCVTDGAVSNGSVSFSITGTEANPVISMTFNNFVTVENGVSNSINGNVRVTVTESANGAISTTIAGSQITMVADGETITYSNYSLVSSQDSAGNASVSGTATITTVDGTLVMTIDPPLVTGISDYPETGTINWSHSDGSSLEINADTGDAATFSYTVNDGVTVTSGIATWAETDVGEISL